MQNLLNDLIDILKNKADFVVEGKLAKNIVVEKALQLDSEFLQLLLTSDSIKKHFFKKIGDVLVFDKVKFQEFVSNKEFLPNSYTSFKNQIGLTNEEGMSFKQNKDVVLTWAYKDCVLEGGQDKEDAKRDEIFYNETLAPDEITRLFAEKVLTNFEKWDKESVDNNQAKPVISLGNNDNFLIKGNNLLVLHCLKKRYANKIKLIYIDPPYNTGNDSFKYNDTFNHSTWLTFMKNRLEVAKELLSEDGSIYVNIDYNEGHYLKVLMDEIFGKENFQREIIWRIGWVSGYKTSVKNYIRNHDTILFYSKNNSKLYFNKDKAYIYNNNFADRTPDDIKKYLQKFGLNSNNIQEIITYINHDSRPDRYPIEDVWNGNEYDELNSIAIMSYSKESISTLLETTADVKGQKSEALLKRIIEISTNPGDVVLDFFAGTGTTGAVALKMHRKFIMCEQLDEHIKYMKLRAKKVMSGTQEGISKSVSWQGGGEFIYCELKQANEIYVQKIRKAQNVDELVSIYDEMKSQAFMRYEIENFDVDKFQKLDFEDAQRILLNCLDKNHLYVNLSEIEDKQYNVSPSEKSLNKEFYKK